MYENTVNMIYQMASQRIKTRRDVMKLKSRSLDNYEPSTVSALIHNKIYPKKNPFLIPYRLVKPLTEWLEYNTAQDLLYGEADEIEAYIGPLFISLVKESLLSEPIIDGRFLRGVEKKDKKAIRSQYMKMKEDLHNALTDYIPYAVFGVELDLLQDYPPDVVDGVIEPRLLKNYDGGVDEEAIYHLYLSGKISDKFKEAYYEFIKNHQYFEDINRDLFFFMRDVVMKIIIKFADTYGYGDKVKELLSHSYREYLAKTSNSDAPKNYIVKYVAATNDYVYKLFKIQDQEDRKKGKVDLIQDSIHMWDSVNKLVVASAADKR